MFNFTNLFAIPIITVDIDPNSFDKAKLLSKVKSNYKISPIRNNWDNSSKLHHYYHDWNNTDYSKIDLSSIYPVYNNVFDQFLKELKRSPLVNELNYKYHIVNITVYKNKGYFMNSHHHMTENTIFSCVHYISLGNNSAKLTFHNPSPVCRYLSTPFTNLLKNKLDEKNTINSFLYERFNFDIKEDQMVIFPSFLEHSVNQDITDTKYRIAIATNLEVC